MSRIEPGSFFSTPGHPLSADRQASGIVDVRTVELGWSGTAIPPAVLVTYDIDTFDVEAFARHGVDMPASIARSVKKRQAEFFMGRLAAGDALAALWAGGRERPSPLKRLPQGAEDASGRHVPIGASRQPVWPDGIVGSITHAGRYAAAVAADARGVSGVTGATDLTGVTGAARVADVGGIGIDIEQRIAAQTRQSVEGTVLNAAEQALLHALAGDLPDERSYETLLTIAFSAKESFFKASFATVGSYFDFDAVELTALDVAGGTLELTLARDLAAALPRGRRVMLRHRPIDADTVLTSYVW
ncbi:MAG TPA: 4'-phosphopantetheinyl transferase superfamily protein [Luteibacter sp.]|uniref:4'-phosphopantetheinyl transferase family protein n=1 Tax=Luteibacter sp. TaxID=1886636 RepID=UPI002BB12196|nr:4'-phosphopantetheinyl transferase superfamily protein [Luteibacter sp.]HVI55952.1 4'-phosphopantetheinyl transferase superfamily protein [Luteibacter sp.]